MDIISDYRINLLCVKSVLWRVIMSLWLLILCQGCDKDKATNTLASSNKLSIDVVKDSTEETYGENDGGFDIANNSEYDTYSESITYESEMDTYKASESATFELEKVSVTCPLCYGIGRCSVCGGGGILYKYGEIMECDNCNGVGVCIMCNGLGLVETIKGVGLPEIDVQRINEELGFGNLYF